MARKLPESAFRLASFVTNRWNVVPDDGTLLEDVLERVYWTNVAQKLRPGDILEVHAPDGSYYAELYVRSASRLEASVTPLVVHKFGDEGQEAGDDGLMVKFRNHVAKWGVIRRVDKFVVRDGFQTQEMANEWLADRRKSKAA